MSKKTFVILLTLLVGLFLATGCSYPEKPVLRGTGPLAVQIDADKLITPEYHNPIESWKPRHMQSVKQKEFIEQDCVSCHKVETSCNNCHDYVGVPQVQRTTPNGFSPGEDRLKNAVNGTTPKE